jgi:hypothetical protein
MVLVTLTMFCQWCATVGSDLASANPQEWVNKYSSTYYIKKSSTKQIIPLGHTVSQPEWMPEGFLSFSLGPVTSSGQMLMNSPTMSLQLVGSVDPHTGCPSMGSPNSMATS